jgi:hypothetical protein
MLDDLLHHYMVEHGMYATVIGEEKRFYGIFHCGNRYIGGTLHLARIEEAK